MVSVSGKNSVKSIRGRNNNLGQKLSLSVMAVFISSSLHSAFAAETTANKTDDTVVVTGQNNAAVTDTAATDYSVPVTTAGTKMALTTRDIPQSVSIISKQRMQDQQLQTLGDVLKNTTGIQESVSDLDRRTYYARGFLIDNYMVDGIPTTFDPRWDLGDSQSDTALFERIEVVRGATGLMTGPGNPSASVNQVRKHADSKEFTGNVSATYGSWNKQRYVADLSTPLNASGSVRGRLITGYQDQNSYVERYGATKKFVYATVDADLTDSTLLSAGYEFQQTNTDSPTWGGMPRWHAHDNILRS
jgi:outer membrane receptor for ferric coprogen and ferric-rhodotorulic acid